MTFLGIVYKIYIYMPPKIKPFGIKGKRTSLPRKAKVTSTKIDVKENVICSKREKNKPDCENDNSKYDDDGENIDNCVWDNDKEQCITAREAGKPIKSIPLSGNKDTTGLYSSSDSLTSIGAPTPTAIGEEAQDDNMTPEEIKVDEERKAAEISTVTNSTDDSVKSTVTNSEEVSQVTPSEYTVSFEGTYDEVTNTFLGTLHIDGTPYIITSTTSGPSSSEIKDNISSSSSPKTDNNIAVINKMLPTIPGITFNIQKV